MTAPDDSPVTRRRFLRHTAVVAGAVAVPGWLAACSGDSATDPSGATSSSTAPPTTGSTTTASPASTVTPDATDSTTTTSAATESVAAVTLTSADFDDLGPCIATRAQAEGPFYLSDELLRRDIREDRTGMPTRLAIQVVDAACVPVPGAIVDIWHADALGDYSAFVDGSIDRGEAGPGTTFLRGSQIADSDAIAEFLTIWPGWYPGRAVHVHFKVHAPDGAVFTSQMYFPDDENDAIYVSGPYESRGSADVRNDADRLAGDLAGSGLVASVSPVETEAGAGRQALLRVGIDV